MLPTHSLSSAADYRLKRKAVTRQEASGTLKPHMEGSGLPNKNTYLELLHEQQINFCTVKTRILFVDLAGVQPQLIQGIRRRDGIGEGQATTA